MSTEVNYPHVVRAPGVYGGRPRVDGLAVLVRDIVLEHEREGKSAEMICQDHPGLTLAHVYSALAYFHDHRQEVLEDIHSGEIALQPSGPASAPKATEMFDELKQDISRIAGELGIHDLPTDLAENHDFYAHGLPKGIDRP
jgi:uncharacterized protein (DUF433 family)